MKRPANLRDRMAWLDPSSIAVIMLFVTLAIIINAAGWSIPISRNFERALFDLRQSVYAPAVEQDDRIVMVVYTEETALLTGKREPLDRQILADALDRLDDMGSKAIALDIPLTSSTTDDVILINQLNQMTTRTIIGAYDPVINPEISYERLELQNSLVGLIENKNVQLASPRLSVDRDGVVRNWPSNMEQFPMFADVISERGPSSIQNRGQIRFSRVKSEDVPVFSKFPIDTLADPEIASLLGDFVKDRYVIIGTDFIDQDRFETSISGLDPFQPTMTGIEIHAHMLSQQLDGSYSRHLPGFVPMLVSVIILFGTYLVASSKLTLQMKFLILASIFLLIIAVPFFVHDLVGGSFDFPAFGWIIAAISGILIAWIIYRETQWQKGIAARSALSRYLPPDVAKTILNRPDGMNLASEKRSVYTMFTDLEGFTSLCHRSDPDEVAEFLNEYLELLSGIILSHGGTIDKFVGDAVVGIWGAPLAKKNDGERALDAAIALYAAGEEIRSSNKWKHLDLGRTRVGLHFGEAIVGNFGGEGRIQYTALGDTMNVAARLEAANKELGTKILISNNVAQSVDRTNFRPMGSVQLRGRDTPVLVFEPNVGSAMSAEDLKQLGKIMDRIEAGDQSAVQELRNLAQTSPEDVALNRLAVRIQSSS